MEQEVPSLQITRAERGALFWDEVQRQWKLLGEEDPAARGEIKTLNLHFLPRLELTQALWGKRGDLRLAPGLKEQRPRFEFKPPREPEISKAEMLTQLENFFGAFGIPLRTLEEKREVGLSLHITVAAKDGRDLSPIAHAYTLGVVNSLVKEGQSSEHLENEGLLGDLGFKRTTYLRSDGSFEHRLNGDPHRIAKELETALTEPEPKAIQRMLSQVDEKQWKKTDFRLYFEYLLMAERSGELIPAAEWSYFIEHPDIVVRDKFWWKTGAVTNLSPSAVSAIVDGLEHGNARTRLHAARALREWRTGSPKTMGALVRTLQDEDVEVRRAAASAVSRQLPGEHISSVVERLNDPDPEVVATLIWGLESTRTSHPMVAPALLKKLHDAANADVDSATVRALMALTPTHPELLPAFLGKLEEAPDSLREFLVKALARTHGHNPVVVDRIMKMTQENDPISRSIAAQALGGIAHEDPTVNLRLIHLLKDRDVWVRRKATEALGSRPVTPAVVMALLRVLASEEESVRIAAIRALAPAQPLHDVITQKFIALLENESTPIREAVLDGLTHIRSSDTAVAMAVLKSCDDPEGYVAMKARRNLRTLRTADPEVLALVQARIDYLPAELTEMRARRQMQEEVHAEVMRHQDAVSQLENVASELQKSLEAMRNQLADTTEPALRASAQQQLTTVGEVQEVIQHSLGSARAAFHLARCHLSTLAGPNTR